MTTSSKPNAKTRKVRKMSAAGRARIGAAARRRWKAYRTAKRAGTLPISATAGHKSTNLNLNSSLDSRIDAAIDAALDRYVERVLGG